MTSTRTTQGEDPLGNTFGLPLMGCMVDGFTTVLGILGTTTLFGTGGMGVSGTTTTGSGTGGFLGIPFHGGVVGGNALFLDLNRIFFEGGGIVTEFFEFGMGGKLGGGTVISVLNLLGGGSGVSG